MIKQLPTFKGQTQVNFYTVWNSHVYTEAMLFLQWHWRNSGNGMANIGYTKKELQNVEQLLFTHGKVRWRQQGLELFSPVPYFLPH